MNAALVLLVGFSIVHWRWGGLTATDAPMVLALVVAGWPLGLGVKVFELRFKVSTEQRRQFLREIPLRRQLVWTGYVVLLLAVLTLERRLAGWALWGAWLQDFWSYYRYRPERLRHLYAVVRTLEELRRFPVPWAWVLPAVLLVVLRVRGS